MTKLFWLQPDNTIVEFPLKAEQSLIGRSSRCDIRIKHPGISSEHAVVRTVAGTATVEDLGSTNGTRVNGKRIETHVLRHGDQIGVGRERLMYFAELDEAARFVQPEAMEPMAQPAPGGEHVNTAVGKPTTLITVPPAAVINVSPRATSSVNDSTMAKGMPELDAALLASLPKGSTLSTSPISRTSTDAAAVTPMAVKKSVPTVSAELRAPQIARVLSASVAVLTGPAAGKRYPLDQPSITIGKEGKQVIEITRTSPSSWQIRQREGITPPYINGDAVSGTRDLVAGDVIELTGVRLRFEIVMG